MQGNPFMLGYMLFFFMIYGEWLYVRTEGGHVGHEPVRSRSFRGKEFLMVGLERKEIILGMFFVFFLIFYFLSLIERLFSRCESFSRCGLCNGLAGDNCLVEEPEIRFGMREYFLTDFNLFL